MMLCSLLRAAPTARACLAASLLTTILSGCGDGTAPLPRDTHPRYDLVFDGEDAAGRRMLYRTPVDGTTPVLIGGGIEGIRPSPTRDGQRIAFHTIETYEARARLGLLAVSNETPEWIDATDASEREMTWSPDNRRVAFVSKRDDFLGGDIFVGDVDGRRIVNLRNLTPRVPASPEIEPQYTPAWSPDGTRIAFTSYRSGGPAIWIMDADGTNARALTNAGDHIDAVPSWSPDGKRIAFQRAARDGVRIGIVSVEDRALRFLPTTVDALAPAWAPDGEHLAVVARLDGEQDVVVVTLDGSITTRIRRPGRDYFPAWIRRVGS